MKKQLLHPATLIAAVALLVALEIPSDAARLIDGKLLKRNSVSGAKLKAGSVSRGKLTASVRTQLDKAGQPGPTGPAGPKGDAGPAGAALSCPAGTALHEMACIELVQHGQQRWLDAANTCMAAKRRLPTLAELMTFRLRTDLDPPTVGSEWTDGLFAQGSTEYAAIVVFTSALAGSDKADDTTVYNFRCVAPATVG